MIGKLLGLDHGLVRIGVAVSDASGLVARELAVIERKSKREDFEKINHFAQREKVVALVVGLPTNLDLPPEVFSPEQKVRNWIEHLKAAVPLPIIVWDEQMTSVDAKELAIQKGRHPRDPIDDLAARVILQSYLDALRDGLAEPPPKE